MNFSSGVKFKKFSSSFENSKKLEGKGIVGHQIVHGNYRGKGESDILYFFKI
jgi:hypothetical protein